MDVQRFTTPLGAAFIARQAVMSARYGREQDGGRVAVGLDIPVVCAWPMDLADRLGIAFCDELDPEKKRE